MMNIFLTKFYIIILVACSCFVSLQGSDKVLSSEPLQDIQSDNLILNDVNGESLCLEPENFNRILPYLLPSDHPLKPALDAIFSASRALLDDEAFAQAGFETLYKQPRSFIRVAQHPNLPGHLIKANLDTGLKLKGHHTSWEWFLRRCETAETIRKIIAQKQFKHFVVPEKYLYMLPEQPQPPNTSNYSRKFLVLLVEYMHLVPRSENLQLWLTMITEEHLNELSEILNQLPNMTLRPNNLVFTKEGKIAFIDTEYVHKELRNHDRLGKFLNPKMRAYWRSLIKLDVLKRVGRIPKHI